MKYRLLLFGICLGACAASAQTVFVWDQNYNDLNPERDQTSMVAGASAVLATISDGVDPVTFSGVTALVLRVIRMEDAHTNHVLYADRTNSPGLVHWSIPPLTAQRYRFVGTAYGATETNDIVDRWVTATNTPVGSGGSTSLTITNADPIAISNTTAVGAPDGYMPAVSNGAIVLGPPPAGGNGGGIQSINGDTNAAQLIVGNSPIVVTNIGGTTFIGWQEYDGGFVINPGTNYTRLYFSGSVTQQIVFSGTGTVALTGWAGAGFGTTYGGSAGLTQTLLDFTNGMYLDVLIPDGGQGLTGTPAITDSAFPNGGRGVGRQCASGGGGAFVIYAGGRTDVVMVAGGGAGGNTSGATYGGFGGGETGGDGAGSRRGYGGSQTNGGALASQTGTMLYTNTVGSHLRGGDAGCATQAQAAVTCNATGGGDGWQGGSGGYAASGEASSGGAGAGYWNPLFCKWGTTIRGGFAAPAGTEIPGYVAGVGVPGGTLNSTRSGTGLLIISIITQ
jgi:hypothetical protein